MLLLLACAEPETTEPATITILSPADGEEVTVGDVDVSVVVENFELLVPLAKHAEGEAPSGWISVSIDGVEVDVVGETNFTMAFSEEGDRDLGVALLLEDGDDLDPPAEDTITLTVAPAG